MEIALKARFKMRTAKERLTMYGHIPTPYIFGNTISGAKRV
jgi:hypothetical protein